MNLLVTLTPAESRRLLAKAVATMPVVRRAFDHANLILCGGTTNAFIAQELTGRTDLIPAQCTVGISTSGVLCLTAPQNRKGFPTVFDCGTPSAQSIDDALSSAKEGTVVIKGANAVDPSGYAGILTAAPDGGSVAHFLGPVTARGIPLIVPVGLEKLIPSVPAAAGKLRNILPCRSMGALPGMYCLTNATVVTEIEAIRILFGAEASLICCGGVGGNEGAVTLAAEGSPEIIDALAAFLESQIKGEPAMQGNKGICSSCGAVSCCYCGQEESSLPQWLQGK